jgi:hypothetical protein
MNAIHPLPTCEAVRVSLENLMGFLPVRARPSGKGNGDG